MVSTGEDGTVVIELEPGVVVQLQPKSQIVIGEILLGGAEDALGNPIPLVSITINSGTIVLLTTENGLAAVGLQVVTPRGISVPVIPGQTTISVAATSTVTVASVSGANMVTTLEGETLPVAEGLVVVLRPDGTYTVMPILDLPNGQAINAAAQNASDNVAGSNLDPGSPPTPPVPPPEPPLPPDPPRPTPTPTPTPTPSPTPTPISP